MASPDKSPKIGIQRWGTRVCVSSSSVSVSLRRSDSCVCFTGLIMSLSVSALFTVPHPRSLPNTFFFFSLRPDDWAWSLTATPFFFSLQVHLLPWLAGNYQPGDSSLFQELRGHQVVFFFPRAKTFPRPPEVPESRILPVRQCQAVTVFLFVALSVSALLPSTSSQAIFDPVTERRAAGRGLVLPS